jgi:hypothetical protein
VLLDSASRQRSVFAMNLKAIIETILQIVGLAKWSDKSKWSLLSVQFSGETVNGTLNSLKADALGLEAKVSFLGEDGAPISVTVKAVHHSPTRMRVLVDGTADPDASLIFAYKGGPLNPSRWAFDFVRATVNGADYRINLRFDP